MSKNTLEDAKTFTNAATAEALQQALDFARAGDLETLEQAKEHATEVSTSLFCILDAVSVVAHGPVNISPNGSHDAEYFDGILVLDLAGDQGEFRVLLHMQDDPIENGIYVFGVAASRRSEDAQTGTPMSHCYVSVLHGNQAAGHGYVCNNIIGRDVVGEHPLSFVKFTAAPSVEAGRNLTKVGPHIHLSDNVSIPGTMRAKSYSTISDERRKRHIWPLATSETSKLSDLNVCTFSWLGDRTEHKIIGLLAGQVAEVLPTVVDRQNSEEYTIDYNQLTAFLIGCVNELERRVHVLEDTEQGLVKCS